MNSQIPIFIGDAELPSGYVELSREAKKAYEDMLAGDMVYVLMPAYTKYFGPDGELNRVELEELDTMPTKRVIDPRTGKVVKWLTIPAGSNVETVNSMPFFSLYTSDLTCGDHDIGLDRRFTSEDAARQAAKDIEKQTLDESEYTLLVRVVQENLEEPYQEVVYEAVRDDGAYEDGPTVKSIKWRTVVDRMEGADE